LIRRFVGRSQHARWALADQGINSLSNFALTILVARSSSPVAFGAFSLGYITYLFLLGIVRALCSEPYLVGYSSAKPQNRKRAVQGATGTAILLGAVLATSIWAVTASLDESLARTALRSVAIWLPALFLQDTWRFVLIANREPRRAALNDGVWGALQLLGAAVVILGYGPDVAAFIAAWGGAALVAALFGAWQARVGPSLRGCPTWLHANRALFSSYLGEFLAVRASGQLTFYAVGSLAGLGALGAMRAGVTLFGPLNVLFNGIRTAFIPEAVKDFERTQSTRRWVVVASTMTSMLACAWGAVALTLPEGVGGQLFGETWTLATPLLLPLALWTFGTALAIGPLIGLRAILALRRGLKAHGSLGLIILVTGPMGAWLGGAYGASVGLAIGTNTGAVLCWYQYLRACNEVGLRGAEQEHLAARRTRGLGGDFVG